MLQAMLILPFSTRSTFTVKDLKFKSKMETLEFWPAILILILIYYRALGHLHATLIEIGRISTHTHTHTQFDRTLKNP